MRKVRYTTGPIDLSITLDPGVNFDPLSDVLLIRRGPLPAATDSNSHKPGAAGNDPAPPRNADAPVRKPVLRAVQPGGRPAAFEQNEPSLLSNSHDAQPMGCEPAKPPNEPENPALPTAVPYRSEPYRDHEEMAADDLTTGTPARKNEPNRPSKTHGRERGATEPRASVSGSEQNEPEPRPPAVAAEACPAAHQPESEPNEPNESSMAGNGPTVQKNLTILQPDGPYATGHRRARRQNEPNESTKVDEPQANDEPAKSQNEPNGEPENSGLVILCVSPGCKPRPSQAAKRTQQSPSRNRHPRRSELCRDREGAAANDTMPDTPAGKTNPTALEPPQAAGPELRAGEAAKRTQPG